MCKFGFTICIHTQWSESYTLHHRVRYKVFVSSFIQWKTWHLLLLWPLENYFEVSTTGMCGMCVCVHACVFVHVYSLAEDGMQEAMILMHIHQF